MSCVIILILVFLFLALVPNSFVIMFVLGAIWIIYLTYRKED